MSRPEPVFLVQDIWTLHSERYCEECPYRQTHISFVPYGEGSTELVDETCALLNDVNIPRRSARLGRIGIRMRRLMMKMQSKFLISDEEVMVLGEANE